MPENQAQPVQRYGISSSLLRSRQTFRERVHRKRSDRRNLDHVFRIVIDQLEPILGDVRGRENIVLRLLRVEGELQIRFTKSLPPVGWRWPV